MGVNFGEGGTTPVKLLPFLFLLVMLSGLVVAFNSQQEKDEQDEISNLTVPVLFQILNHNGECLRGISFHNVVLF
ncbi:hypothetical protein AAMO2058_001367900 [Amorphochlora amoebiformis]